MPVAARDVKSIDRMQHADSKQIVMTTPIYLQSYKTATLFSTRNHSFCFNSESRLSQIFLLGTGEVTLLLQDEHFAKNRKGLSLLLSELDLSQ